MGSPSPASLAPLETLAFPQLRLTSAPPFLVAPTKRPPACLLQGFTAVPLLSLCPRNKHRCLDGGNGSAHWATQFTSLRPQPWCGDSVCCPWSWVGRASSAVPWPSWASSWEEWQGVRGGLPAWTVSSYLCWDPWTPHLYQAGPTSWELFVPTAGNWRGFLHGPRPSTVTFCEQAVQE